jgi:hypothetical protein
MTGPSPSGAPLLNIEPLGSCSWASQYYGHVDQYRASLELRTWGAPSSEKSIRFGRDENSSARNSVLVMQDNGWGRLGEGMGSRLAHSGNTGRRHFRSRLLVSVSPVLGVKEQGPREGSGGSAECSALQRPASAGHSRAGG